MSHPPPPNDQPPLDPPRPSDPYGWAGPAGGQFSGPAQPSPSGPQPPTYQPGYAQPGYAQPGYAQPGYAQPGYAQPGYAQSEYGDGHPGYPPTTQFPAYDPVPSGTTAPGPRIPRRSNVPLVAVIIAVTVLLCGGTAVAGVLGARYVTDRAKEAVKPVTELPAVPTELPTLPTDLPALPTDLPGLPGLPTDSNGDPYVPDGRTTVRVRYEVAGDGRADITYIDRLGQAPKRVKNAKLPWRTEVSMTGATLVSVVAFRTDTSEGSIRCRAEVDGERVAERDARGAFAVVTCSKLVLN